MGAFTEIKESRIDKELEAMAATNPREYAERVVQMRYDLACKDLMVTWLDQLADGYREGFPEVTKHTDPETGEVWYEDRHGDEVEDGSFKGILNKRQAEEAWLRELYLEK